MRAVWLLLFVPCAAGCGSSGGGPLLGDGGGDGAFDDGTTHDHTEPEDHNGPDTMPPTEGSTPDSPLDTGVKGGCSLNDAGPEASVLSLTGGPCTMVGAKATSCSASSTMAASFQVLNDSDASVDIVWVDYSCAKVPKGTVSAGGAFAECGFSDSTWEILKDSDKSYIGGFYLEGNDVYTVTVR